MRRGSDRKPEEQANYLASVSDLMSALLYVFILAIVVFMLNMRSAEENLLKAEETLRRTEEEKQEEILQLRGADLALAEFLERLQSALQERGLNVHIDLEHGALRLPEEILFRSGRVEFNPGAKENLEMLAEELEKILPCYSGGSNCPDRKWDANLEAIFVEGHTDDQPVREGSHFRDNWELSAARSIRTFDVLMSHRPALRSFMSSKNEPLFGIAGYADSRRVDMETTPEARQKNRRIDLRFLMSPPKRLLAEEGQLKVGEET